MILTKNKIHFVELQKPNTLTGRNQSLKKEKQNKTKKQISRSWLNSMLKLNSISLLEYEMTILGGRSSQWGKMVSLNPI